MNPSPRRSRRAHSPRETMRPEAFPGPAADPDAAPPGRPLPDLLPHNLRECTFAGLDPLRAWEAHRVCQKYAGQGQFQGHRGLFLFGPPGAGKSSLAAAILHQVVDWAQNPHQARFWPLRRSLQVIRETQGQPPAQRLSLTDLLASPLAILDQLEGPTSLWEAHQLELLLPLLWDDERQIVVTTDLSIKELEQALSPLWVWRLLAMYKWVWVGR